MHRLIPRPHLRGDGWLFLANSWALLVYSDSYSTLRRLHNWKGRLFDETFADVLTDDDWSIQSNVGKSFLILNWY